jgi:hypothetical protein
MVRSVSLRHRNASYLVATPPGAPKEHLGKKAMLATFESLLGGCPGSEGKPDWVIDAGAGSGEIAALAASEGCAVAAFEPRPKDVWALRTTGCLNDAGKPFVVFPAVAAAEVGRGPVLLGKNATLNQSMAELVTIDSVFSEGAGRQLAVGGAEASAGADWGAKVALLKVTQRECCDTGATLTALQGAGGLLSTGRVRCLLVEVNFDKQTTSKVFEILTNLEQQGYSLAHPGPLDSPEIEIEQSGAYQLFRTDVEQLTKIYENFDKIRRFDERTGYRAYSGGLSLDRDGRYFEYSDLVLGCRDHFPQGLVVRSKATIRYKDGRWYPDKVPEHILKTLRRVGL